jgi:hypothetical protein
MPTNSAAVGEAPTTEGRDVAAKQPDEWDYDENDCANCGGEGFTYGCSWDWQCETYDEGEGTCLCIRRCEWCAATPPAPQRHSGSEQ